MFDRTQPRFFSWWNTANSSPCQAPQYTNRAAAPMPQPSEKHGNEEVADLMAAAVASQGDVEVIANQSESVMCHRRQKSLG